MPNKYDAQVVTVGRGAECETLAQAVDVLRNSDMLKIVSMAGTVNQVLTGAKDINFTGTLFHTYLTTVPSGFFASGKHLALSFGDNTWYRVKNVFYETLLNLEVPYTGATIAAGSSFLIAEINPATLIIEPGMYNEPLDMFSMPYGFVDIEIMKGAIIYGRKQNSISFLEPKSGRVTLKGGKFNGSAGFAGSSSLCEVEIDNLEFNGQGVDIFYGWAPGSFVARNSKFTGCQDGFSSRPKNGPTVFNNCHLALYSRGLFATFLPSLLRMFFTNAHVQANGCKIESDTLGTDALSVMCDVSMASATPIDIELNNCELISRASVATKSFIMGASNGSRLLNASSKVTINGGQIKMSAGSTVSEAGVFTTANANLKMNHVVKNGHAAGGGGTLAPTENFCVA